MSLAHETKALPHSAAPQSRELLDAFDEFLVAFEAFKSANDERLEEIETRLSADVVTEEKVDRINRALSEHKAALDRMALEARRPALGAPAGGGGHERKAAFHTYMRTGDMRELARFETKALSAGSGPDGGHVVPPETEAIIDRLLAESSPMRRLASVRQIGAGVFRKPVSLGGLTAGWVGESAARPETDTSQLALVEFPAMELYAMPAATQTLLDDAYVDVDAWLAEEIRAVFAAQEMTAFVSGDGTAKPRGFLDYTKVADASWSWGNVGYLATGVAGDFAASDPGDVLIDLVYTPKQTYRANARWVMNRKTEAAVRKLVDASGDYMWKPGAAAGDAATLLGYPIAEIEEMPDIGTNSFSIGFGDMARFYLIVDRVGVRVLRDPYSAKPFVLFYTTKRVGGGVQNFEAMKLLRFGVS